MATEKFKAVVHYVIASCDDPKRLGATRLNKILWFADTLAYRAHGDSITGEAYVKRQYGPVPKAILATLRELQDEGKIVVRDDQQYGLPMRMFLALTKPSEELLSPSDKFLVDTVMADVCGNHTASSISDLSHDQIWEAANEGEEIPLYATLAASPGEITEDVMNWADSVINSRQVKAPEMA